MWRVLGTQSKQGPDVGSGLPGRGVAWGRCAEGRRARSGTGVRPGPRLAWQPGARASADVRRRRGLATLQLSLAAATGFPDQIRLDPEASVAHPVLQMSRLGRAETRRPAKTQTDRPQGRGRGGQQRAECRPARQSPSSALVPVSPSSEPDLRGGWLVLARL